MEIIDRLKNIVTQYSDANTEITSSSLLANDLGLNSFDLVSLVCEVEDEFSVEIPDRAIPQLVTVGDVVDYVAKQRA